MLQEQRINTPISTVELERRWQATRDAMRADGIDVLIMQANNDFMGGYPKWFTDIPSTQGYADILTFPVDDGMTLVSQGPFGKERQVPADDPVFRGVSKVLTAAFYSTASFSHAYDAELAAKALTPYAKGRIGLVGLSTLSHYLVDHLRQEFPQAEFVDASDLVDRIKAIKSPEEIEVIRATAALQDRAVEAAFEALGPGKLDRDITAAAEFVSLGLGSEQGLYMCASYPVGSSAFFRNRHFQNREIQAGDQFDILVENNGAGGYYLEIGRKAVLGSATDEMHREFEFTLEARAFMLERLRPGANGADIWNEYNEFMKSHGKPEEDRLHCHGQGYDLVERPYVRFDETMPLAAGMVVACHPGFADANGFHWVCDAFLIGEEKTERLHAFPERITEFA